MSNVEWKMARVRCERAWRRARAVAVEDPEGFGGAVAGDGPTGERRKRSSARPTGARQLRPSSGHPRVAVTGPTGYFPRWLPHGLLAHLEGICAGAHGGNRARGACLPPPRAIPLLLLPRAAVGGVGPARIWCGGPGVEERGWSWSSPARAWGVVVRHCRRPPQSHS